MESKGCDIPTPIKVLGWGLAGLVALYFYKEFLEYPNAKCFLEKQGSLIAGIIAFAAAVIALHSQKASTQRQIESQRELEEKRLFKEKIEEAYNAANSLRLNILLTRTKDVKDTTKDIDIFNYDIEKVEMLCQLYGIVNSEIADGYWKRATDFLNIWSDYAGKRLTSEGVNEADAEGVLNAMKDFTETTDKLIEELISNMRKL